MKAAVEAILKSEAEKLFEELFGYKPICSRQNFHAKLKDAATKRFKVNYDVVVSIADPELAVIIINKEDGMSILGSLIREFYILGDTVCMDEAMVNKIVKYSKKKQVSEYLIFLALIKKTKFEQKDGLQGPEVMEALCKMFNLS